jgi:hypothetical protein
MTDDLKTGLQSSIIVDGAAEHQTTNLEISRLYGLLHWRAVINAIRPRNT